MAQPAVAVPVPTGPSTSRVNVASDGTQANGFSTEASINASGRYVAFDSYATNLVSGDTNGYPDVFIRDRQAGTTSMVSVSSEGVQSNRFSDVATQAISADGRYVAFSSSATNLVPGPNTEASDIFVRDRWAGTTSLISVASDGGPGNGACSGAAINATGRYVAFGSDSSNLVAGDTNDADDVFIRDRQTNTTTRLSVASDGTQANDRSDAPVISANGRYVAFPSQASNLVPEDTNGVRDVFVRDRLTGTTTRASVASDGTQANGESANFLMAISANGRFVTFGSFATNLVPEDTNGVQDIFVRDLSTGTTSRVSLSSDGTQANGYNLTPTINANGRYVAFVSEATNLVPGDTNDRWDIFVRDRWTGTTRRISVSTNGAQANDHSERPTITAAGLDVAFLSDASNLVPGDTNGFRDVFVRHWSA